MKYPDWMPPVVDDAKARSGKSTGQPATSGDNPQDVFAQIMQAAATAAGKAARPDWVQQGRDWRTKSRRWVIRACWRLFVKTMRKAAARAAVLAPFLICAMTYFVAAIMSLFDRGWLSILAGAAAGAPIVYWRLGGWAWVLTRRRELRPLSQRIWYASAYATITLLGVMTAAWRVGAPMPGLWLLTAMTLSIATAWNRRSRDDKPQVDQLDVRYRLWEKEKKVAGAELGLIYDYTGPVRWEAQVDLTDTDLLVADLAKHAPHLAKRFRVGRTDVIIDDQVPGQDALARLTVVLENPLVTSVDFDESWLKGAEPGCLPFHLYPDGPRGQFRLFTPMSGTVNAFFSGDIGSGKSGGIFTAAIQACMTGRVHLIVGDPQGQSLPALKKVASAYDVDAEAIYHRMVKLHAGMMARSAYLANYVWRDRHGDLNVGMEFFDQDLMARQNYDALTGEHPLHWPIIVFILEEAHKACQDPEYGKAIIALLGQMVKLSRKTGIALWVANQNPGIEELGNEMAIRQNLIAGNVLCYRNSSKYAGNMILEAHMPEPHTIPKLTPAGELTQGMVVASCPVRDSARATIARSAFIERKTYWASRAAERIMPLEQVTVAAHEAADVDAQEAAVAEQLAAYQAGKTKTTQPVAAAASTTAVLPWRTGSTLARCVAYLQHLEQTTGYGEATTGVLAEQVGAELNTVSTALGRGAKPTKKRPVPLCHSPQTGTWSLGPAPDKELVGAAA